VRRGRVGRVGRVDRDLPARRAAVLEREEFVVREMRGRARAVRRGWIAAAFLPFALALFVRPPARRRGPP